MTQDPVFDIPAEIEVTTVKVPESDAICVEAGPSTVTIFGDGRVHVVSSLPVDINTPDVVEFCAPVVNFGVHEELHSS